MAITLHSKQRQLDAPRSAAGLLEIKNLLRKAAARSKETLVEAIGVALSVITAADSRGFFEHAGYRPVGKLL